MATRKRRNFCEISPFTYMLSEKKEILKRHISNTIENVNFAKETQTEKLPVLVMAHDNYLIKKGKGIDPELQYNKVTNIKLASDAINGVIIHPGETFSFWNRVGKVTAKKGYKNGRVIEKNSLIAGLGGGLCNLANTVNLLVLHSPLDIVEFHKHSDALAPDGDHRIPMGTGTSISYNYIDYRFKNNTDQDFQLLLWCEDETSFAELRCEKEFPYKYELIEEDHHFEKEGNIYYRHAKVYRNVIDINTNEVLKKELIWNNHSKVMFDYDLIPKELIRNK